MARSEVASASSVSFRGLESLPAHADRPEPLTERLRCGRRRTIYLVRRAGLVADAAHFQATYHGSWERRTWRTDLGVGRRPVGRELPRPAGMPLIACERHEAVPATWQTEMAEVAASDLAETAEFARAACGA